MQKLREQLHADSKNAIKSPAFPEGTQMPGSGGQPHGEHQQL